MKLNEKIEIQLKKDGYSEKTSEIYNLWFNQLSAYYNNELPENISEIQIKEYLVSLLNRVNRGNLSISSVHQALHSFNIIFNKVFKKNFDILSIPLPPRTRSVPIILSQSEIFALFSNVTEIRLRCALGLIYSAGLDVGEAVKLKVDDIDFVNKFINVRKLQNRLPRKVILSDYVAKDLKEYIDLVKPQKYLFVGKPPSPHLSRDFVQKGFKRVLKELGILKNVTVRNLRYSYIKHLEWQGIPLRNILFQQRGLNRSKLFYFSEIEPSDIFINHSPLDRIMSGLQETKVDLTSLRKFIEKIQDEDVRTYFIEAVNCINVGSLRAGVIFVWTATIKNIQVRCMNHSLNLINQSLKSHNPKAPTIDRIEDFSYIKDSSTLLLSEDLGIFDKNQRGILEECLNLRNKCGHPSNYSPLPLKVAAYIEDIISIVFN